MRKRPLRLLSGDVAVGEIVDPAVVKPHFLRAFYSQRLIDMVVEAETADTDGAPAVPPAPEPSQAEPEPSGLAGSSPVAAEALPCDAPPPPQDTQDEQAAAQELAPALPDGWRKFGAVALRKLAGRVTGIPVPTGAVAKQLLARYEAEHAGG